MITIAHNSGGPQSDILVPLPSGQSVGYLESTAAGYARAMVEILAEEARGSEEQQRMREAARARASEFSDDVFDKQLQKHLMPFVQQCKSKSQPA